MRLIYIVELYFRGVGAGYNSAPSSAEVDALIVADRENSGNWTLNFLEPWLKILSHKAFTAMQGIADHYGDQEWAL